jgi:hypothetical protein
MSSITSVVFNKLQTSFIGENDENMEDMEVMEDSLDC